MSRITRYPELKSELKQLAKSIRAARITHKTAQRENGYNGNLHPLQKLSREFRHKHIAYCLLHGTPMDRIEVKTNNPPNQELIKEAMEHYGQDVCVSAVGLD